MHYLLKLKQGEEYFSGIQRDSKTSKVTTTKLIEHATMFYEFSEAGKVAAQYELNLKFDILRVDEEALKVVKKIREKSKKSC